MSAPSSMLLPGDALKGVRVGVSVSETPDLARLGLTESHFRLALGEIARAVLVLGGKLAYGGHMRQGGYTAFLMSELARYGRPDRPLLHCLAWSEHRQTPLSILKAWRSNLGLYGELICLDPDGNPIPDISDRPEDPLGVMEPGLVRQSLTGLRRHMASITSARVLIGGKRSGFQGELPGLMEEAAVSLEAGQPLFLAGGFGGVTLDIAGILHPGSADWLPTSSLRAAEEDPRYAAGLARIRSLAGKQEPTGLTADESARLAANYRPSEIAALLSVGLGRLGKQGRLRALSR